MNVMTYLDDGLRAFLERHCPEPDGLVGALTCEKRLVTKGDRDALCMTGDEADCVWVVEEGRFRIETGGLIATRGRGDILGEMAFLRPEGEARRGNDIIADGRGKVWRIDRTVIARLLPDLRALWFETLSRSLVAKLDEASRQRAAFLREVSKVDHIVKRLVCQEGVEATMAALSATGDETIPPVETTALVWFSDVAGFSALSERLGAEEVGRVLRSVIDPQVEEIERVGGQVDKYMGDGVMAFWLAPDGTRLARAAAGAAEAAMRAAERVREVAERHGLEVGVRVGLHAGSVAVGDFGGGRRIAFTLVGQVVNSTARYEQYKPEAHERDGAVRLSDVVYRLLPDDGRGGFHPEPIVFRDKHGRSFTAYLSHS